MEMLKQRLQLPPITGEKIVEKKKKTAIVNGKEITLEEEKPFKTLTAKELIAPYSSDNQFNLPPGINSGSAQSGRAIAEAKMDSNMVNNIINVGSFLFKRTAGVALSMLGSTNAYGGQDPSKQHFPMMSDSELKAMIKKDERIKAIQGMSKKEINKYDLMQKMKPNQGRNPNATYLSQN